MTVVVRDLLSAFARIAAKTDYFDADLNEVELTDVNQRNWAGDTPLHVVVMSGDVEDIGVLISHGALIDARGERKMTPLHYAAMKDRLDMARILIERGADPNLRDVDGKRPLDWARNIGSNQMVVLLTDAEKAASVAKRSVDGG